jgi:hypothetical protein
MAVLEIKNRPSRRDLAWFGPILLAAVAIFGGVAWFRFDAPRAAVWIWAIGGAISGLYFAVPALRIPVYLGWMRLFFPIGWMISHLVLAVLFFLVVTPTAMVLRLVRYDPLKRRWDRSATTYWTDHRTGEETSRYLRQF